MVKHAICELILLQMRVTICSAWMVANKRLTKYDILVRRAYINVPSSKALDNRECKKRLYEADKFGNENY